MKKKVLSVLLVAAMSLTMLVGCGSKTDTATNEGGDAGGSKDEIVIGVLMKDNSDTFVKKIADAIEAKGKEEGVTILMNDAEGDVNQQIEQCENLIIKQVDAIILNAQDMDGSSPCITKANEAGIPIINCNTDTTNTDYTAFVGCEDKESGLIQANFVLENLAEGSNVCMIQGPMGQAAQVGRLAGYDEANLFETYNLLTEQTANWKREEALALAEDWLVTYGDKLNAIICQNDDMALGALAACKAANRSDVMIVGIDAIEDALVAVEKGEIACTVYQDAAGQGGTAVTTAVAIAKGEDVEKDTRIPFKLITKDNVAEYK
jgi:ABC-type sugar transport system substrate-binding protein